MSVATVFSFQVVRKAVRKVYCSGLYIDVWEIKYQPEPKDLGEKKRYRISFSLDGKGESEVWSEVAFDNDKDAIHYALSDDFTSKAKEQLTNYLKH